MKDKVRIRFVIVILLEISEVAQMKICKGFNGTSYCSGYEWDQGQSMCKPCKTGYHGISCGFKCPPLFFGLGCQSQCSCSAKVCDYIYGCRQITEEQPYHFRIGSNYYVKTTELNDYKHSYNEKPNATEIKYGTKIMRTALASRGMMTHHTNSIIYGIIGLSVAAVIITIIYLFTYQLEKRKIPITTA